MGPSFLQHHYLLSTEHNKHLSYPMSSNTNTLSVSTQQKYTISTDVSKTMSCLTTVYKVHNTVYIVGWLKSYGGPINYRTTHFHEPVDVIKCIVTLASHMLYTETSLTVLVTDFASRYCITRDNNPCICSTYTKIAR